MSEMKLKDMYPNPDQPRTNFSQNKLAELAQSIKENGLLEPIVVTSRSDRFMIVAGERRWRASNLAGLDSVPVRIIEADDRTVAELALLENLQREDLNLIEEARGYQRLMGLGLTMEQVAQKMGFRQPWRVRERLDLLRLHPMYQDYLVRKMITPSQAYEISRLPEEKQHMLHKKIEEGRADTYNKLRALANALLIPPAEQVTFGGPPSAEQLTIGKKYDRMLERLGSFIAGSFDQEDLRILKKVTGSSVEINIQKIDLIIADLNKIKKAMTDAAAGKEALSQAA